MKGIRALFFGMALFCIVNTLFYSLDTAYKVSANGQISKILFRESDHYRAIDLYNHSIFLAEQFPELVELEILDYSLDNNPIYVVRIGENLQDPLVSNNQRHGLVESGTHSREVANPVIAIQIMENYIRDYYDESYNREISTRSILNQSVLHFIILTNPDGYDLSKFGLASVENESAYTKISSFDDTNYSQYKSNLNGIDINRNFPGVYQDTTLNEWKNEEEPGAAYYGGEPASEIETQALMAYVDRYDFRFAMSLHSRGEIIYYDKWFVEDALNDWFRIYADIAGTLSGYEIIEEEARTGVGYFSEYFVTKTLKPCITIETLDIETELPAVSEEALKEAYNKTLNIPYRMMAQAIKDFPNENSTTHIEKE